MAAPTNWQLARYYYTGINDARFLEDCKNIRTRVLEFQKSYKPTFHTFHTAEQFAQFYQDFSALYHTIQTPGYYIFYLASLDTQNQDVIKWQKKLDEQYAEVARELLFIQDGWKQIGRETILRLAADPLLLPYKNDLLGTADELRYLLDTDIESALLHKQSAFLLPIQLHDELVGAFRFQMKKGDTILSLTEEEIRAYRQDANRDMRKNSYDALRAVYNLPSHQITLGNMYIARVKDWVSDAKMRGYSDNPLAKRNIAEELDDDVVDTLLETVEASYPLYRRYLAAKRKNLGLSEEEFAVWDTSAPIPSTEEQKIPFEKGFKMHLRMAGDFDAEYAQFSQNMLEGGRIDVFPRAGKRGGAFASYRKGDPSFVLLNYTEHLRDVSTLSHELGHAYHGYLSQAQEAPVYDTPLVLAETASIFSELLLAESIKNTISDFSYFSYLDEKLIDIFASIHRQIQYTLFEREVHTRIAHGEELGYRDLNILWRGEQEKLYGSIRYDVDAEEESTWSQIPHILHTPFYCYAYAFGQILSYTLFASIRAGKMSVEDYKNLLRAGGSLRPKELLAQYGIDIASKEFFEFGLAEIEKLVAEYESLGE